MRKGIFSFFVYFCRANYFRMEKIYFTDFVRADAGLTHEKLREWQRKYPASPLLNMFCLKDVSLKVQGRQRAKMLLTLPDKLRFDALQLETPSLSSTLHPITKTVRLLSIS